MLIALKVFIAAGMISYAYWLAGKKPILAGFLIALPISSLLSILFTYIEHRDMAKVNAYAVSILVSVPLSLAFFIPFVANRWLKLSFPVTLLAALALLAAAYFVHQALFKGAQ